jgi:ABC-2 type transport system permease protein
MTNDEASPLLLLPALSLWRREVVRFLRQRSRIVGALGTPVVFWLLIGSGLRNSFQAGATAASATDGVDYLEYFFPGTVLLIVLFTAIFATISIIEDRREGFLQAVVAAPVHRLAIVLGKVLGSSTLALGQAMLFLILTPLAGVPVSFVSIISVFLVLVPIAIGLSALGVLIAWPMESTQGFHAVMNLFLIPMWMLSGALFPAGGASAWVRWLMAINPVSYCLAAVRHALYASSGHHVVAAVSPGVAVGVTILFAAVMLIAAERVVATKG